GCSAFLGVIIGDQHFIYNNDDVKEGDKKDLFRVKIQGKRICLEVLDRVYLLREYNSETGIAKVDAITDRSTIIRVVFAGRIKEMEDLI
ncbi:MAG: hypothetical protein AABY05_01460, partial [Nanoarchaeota archaeon]